MGYRESWLVADEAVQSRAIDLPSVQSWEIIDHRGRPVQSVGRRQSVRVRAGVSTQCAGGWGGVAMSRTPDEPIDPGLRTYLTVPHCSLQPSYTSTDRRNSTCIYDMHAADARLSVPGRRFPRPTRPDRTAPPKQTRQLNKTVIAHGAYSTLNYSLHSSEKQNFQLIKQRTALFYK